MTDEIISLTIADVVYRGKGLARHDGYVVFVPGVLTGETVKARITKKRKNFAEAELVEIEKPSPERITPICPLAEECPGCVYMHMNYEEEVRMKNKQFQDMLQRKAKVDPSCFLPPVPSPQNIGYRNKIVLHTGKNPEDKKNILGYYGEDNDTILDIPRCHLAEEDINVLLKQKRRDHEFMRRLKRGNSVTFRHTPQDGAICWTEKGDPGSRRLIENTSFGQITVHRRNFFQVNPHVRDLITEAIQNVLREDKPEMVIDLYCGVGVLALAAGKAGVPSAMGIDSDRAAIRSAIKNSKQHDMKNIEFISEPAAKGLQMALDPIDVEKCTLIVDPPRRGLEKDVIEAISKKPPRQLIYISCAADMLTRDIEYLAKMGYTVKKAQLFDMFPRTPYFESVTILNRA